MQCNLCYIIISLGRGWYQCTMKSEFPTFTDFIKFKEYGLQNAINAVIYRALKYRGEKIQEKDIFIDLAV